jgi:hypothetical protein
MHKKIGVCVDDMIVKPEEERDHIQISRKLFKRLRKYKLKLCIFRVESEKLLGFVIRNTSTEVVPDQFKAMQVILTPKTEK